MNEVLFFVEIIVIFGLILAFKRLFGKVGLFIWIALASVIANIEVVKSVDLFGMSATLGNVLFASNFLATDILSECYEKKDAKKGVYIGLFSVIAYLICTQFLLAFQPNNIDVAHGAMETLFSLAPRICVASLAMFFIANLTDVYLFDKLAKKFNGKKLWLRNNISTIICNCAENVGFAFLAFYGVYPVNDLIMMAIVGSIIEIIIAFCDTPFLYAAKKIRG